jgi:osmoprotectant transport system substrate-binding protein
MTNNDTRRELLKKGGVLAGGSALTSIAGCTGLMSGGSGKVKVSSKRYTEQKILGYLAIEALKENTDLNVVDETGLGGSQQNFQALKSNEVDMYWEYTGTAWYTIPPQHDETVGDPEEIYSNVKSEFNEEYEMQYLNRAPFNNTFVLMANPDWVEKSGVKSLSGLAEYINAGNTNFDIVLTTEYLDRPDGWKGTAEHYGFADQLSKLEGNIKETGIGLTYQILGKGEADVGLGYNTNPQIVKWDLQVLEDDKQFFPIYTPAPLVNKQTWESVGDTIKQPLNKIGPTLDTETIRGLNQKVSIEGGSPQQVARSHLKDQGII